MVSIFRNVREYLTPVLKSSAFLERGVLTPEEFIIAGDELVFKCPTWRWEGGDPKKAKPYLPANKQYLITSNVPCYCRVSSLENTYVGEATTDEGNIDDEWLETKFMNSTNSSISENKDEIIDAASMINSDFNNWNNVDDEQKSNDILNSNQSNSSISNDLTQPIDSNSVNTQLSNNIQTLNISNPTEKNSFAGNIVDAYQLEEANMMPFDDATLSPSNYLRAEEPSDNIVHTRRYDLSITYDKYYQTPRLWLFGYDEAGQYLTAEQIFEDIVQDYAQRTVTIESHPHSGTLNASIHPCQHAAVMKRIVGNIFTDENPPVVNQV